ncbi:hypothetical protein CPB85DRAFT_217124 [Mucidula mucida]|nr:hypothetical protein CPB85DRAFT_217124 [Mucidula mucida]
MVSIEHFSLVIVSIIATRLLVISLSLMSCKTICSRIPAIAVDLYHHSLYLHGLASLWSPRSIHRFSPKMRITSPFSFGLHSFTPAVFFPVTDFTCNPSSEEYAIVLVTPFD